MRQENAILIAFLVDKEGYGERELYHLAEDIKTFIKLNKRRLLK